LKKRLSIGTASAEPGAKGSGLLEVVKRPDGSPINLPVLIVNGAEEGPTFVVNAALHGSEIPSIYSIIKLYHEMDPKKLKGTFIGVPILNYPAFEGRRRTVELTLSDPGLASTDLRYPGNPKGWIQQRIAYTFFNEIAIKADYYIDHHGGSRDYEQVRRVLPNTDPGSMEMAKATGFQFLLKPTPPQGIIVLLKEKGKLKTSIGMEAGGGTWHVKAFLEAVNGVFEGDMNVMKYLGMLEGKQTLLSGSQMIVDRLSIGCNNGGLLIPEPAWEMRKEVQEGTCIAKILNIVGDEIERLIAPCDGIIMGGKRTLCVQPGESILRFGKIIEVVKP